MVLCPAHFPGKRACVLSEPQMSHHLPWPVLFSWRTSMGSHVLCYPAPLAFSCVHAQLAHLYGTEPVFTQFICLLSAQTLLRKMMLSIWPHEGWSPGLARPVDLWTARRDVVCMAVGEGSGDAPAAACPPPCPRPQPREMPWSSLAPGLIIC